MTSDARISTGLPAHPKTKKLIRRAGVVGAWHLVCLFLWAADNRSDGELTGMSDEDIELAVDWPGEDGAFVRELVAVGFLDGEEGGRSIHDWEEHNPWAAGSDARSEKSRFAALCKQHGRAEAARKMPNYAARMLAAVPNSASGTATGTPVALPNPATGVPVAESGSAPSPSPSPSPIPNTPHTPQGGKRGRKTETEKNACLPGFTVFWTAYPRKIGKQAAMKAWVKLCPDEALQAEILGALAAQKPHLDKRENGRFIPHPSTWLNAGQWDDELPGGKPAPIEADGRVWWQIAGFGHPAEAASARCHIVNYREFRDGKQIPSEEVV